MTPTYPSIQYQLQIFLPITFHPPGSELSIHIAVYLPTLGLENNFVNELSKLSLTVDELIETHPGAQYISGEILT